MDPEPGEVIFFHGHPSWASLAAFYLKGSLAGVIAGASAGVVSAIGDGRVHVAWVVVAVIAVFLVLTAVGQLRRIQTTYSITNRRLTIETGLFSRQLHQTLLERVQSVNCTQSVSDRVLGVGTVDFDTAAEAEFDFCFRGVGDPRGIVRTVDRALQELRGDRRPRTVADR